MLRLDYSCRGNTTERFRIGVAISFVVLALCMCAGSYAARTDGFHIDLATGTVRDAFGRSFVMFGINHLLADYDNYDRNWYGRDNGIPGAMSPTGRFAQDSIPYLATHKFNMVRLQWRMTPREGSLDDEQLKTAVETTAGLKMAPMVQLHDCTCSDEGTCLQNAATYWSTFWGALSIEEADEYRRYLIINIANEWGPWDHDPEDWRDQYKAAISTIRSSGFEGLLVIDGPGCAQQPEAIIAHGQELLDHDPAHNLLFSLHIYEDFQSHYDLDTVLQTLAGAHIPITIGEFGPRNGADALAVMQSTVTFGAGYCGWAWQGDGSSGCCNTTLNVVAMVDDIPGSGGNELCECWIDFRDWKGEDGAGSPLLTTWGDTLITHSLYGVVANARPATIFQELFCDGFESGDTTAWSLTAP